MAVKFNPFTGNFDFIGNAGSSSSTDENFSYTYISPSQTKTIPSGQQMLVDGHMTVDGHLSVLGSIVDISKRVVNNFFYDLIDAEEVVQVESNRLLLYKGHLTVRGHLRVSGRVTES